MVIPGTWDLTETHVIKRDFKKTETKDGGCRHQLVALVCAMFCTEKQKKRKKLDEVVAEKMKSAWLIHFAVRAGAW